MPHLEDLKIRNHLFHIPHCLHPILDALLWCNFRPRVILPASTILIRYHEGNLFLQYIPLILSILHLLEHANQLGKVHLYQLRSVV